MDDPVPASSTVVDAPPSGCRSSWRPSSVQRVDPSAASVTATTSVPGTATPSADGDVSGRTSTVAVPDDSRNGAFPARATDTTSAVVDVDVAVAAARDVPALWRPSP